MRAEHAAVGGEGAEERRQEVAEALAAVLAELRGAEAELEQRWDEVAQAEARLGTLLSMGDEMAHLRQHLANRDRLLELQGQQGQGQGQGQGDAAEGARGVGEGEDGQGAARPAAPRQPFGQPVALLLEP